MHSLTITSITIAAAITTLATPLAANPKSPTAQITHQVVKGETMWSIAQRHQTSVGEIMEYNNLSSHIVREGMNLKIPARNVVTPGKPSPSVAPRPTTRSAIHIVRDGDTFWNIAEKYKVSPEALAKANPNINPNRIHRDMELNVPTQQSLASTASKTKLASLPAAETKKTTSNKVSTSAPTIKGGDSEYVLAQGETFYSISRARGIKLSDLLAANPNLKPERLRPGTKIMIPGGASKVANKPTENTTPFNKIVNNTTGSTPGPSSLTNTKPASVASNNASQKPALPNAAPQKTNLRHVVADGDSIASIAKKYSISPDELLKQNHLKETDSIYIDDVLIIPIKGTSSPTTVNANTAAVSNSPAKTSETKPAAKPETVSTSPAPKSEEPSASANTENKAPQLTAAKPEVTAPVDSAARKPKPQPTQFEVAPDGSIRSYIISAGETEETICEAFGITKKELFEHNKLPMGAKLRPGDEIMIPATTKAVVSR